MKALIRKSISRLKHVAREAAEAEQQTEEEQARIGRDRPTTAFGARLSEYST